MMRMRTRRILNAVKPLLVKSIESKASFSTYDKHSLKINPFKFSSSFVLRRFSNMIKSRIPNHIKIPDPYFFVEDDINASDCVKGIYKEISNKNVVEATKAFISSPAFGPREWYYYATHRLLQQKKDPNVRDSNGNSALHLLAHKINKHDNNNNNHHAYDIFAYRLLEHGANPEAVNNEMKIPVQICFEACQSHKDVSEDARYLLDILIDAMNNYNYVDQYGWSLLHHAVYKERLDIVIKMLDKGVNPNQSTDQGVTPLHLALYRRMILPRFYRHSHALILN